MKRIPILEEGGVSFRGRILKSLIALGLLLAGGAHAPAAQSAQTELESELAALGRIEQQVVRFLLEDWSIDLSSTGVDLAMESLDLDPADADLRYRVGSFIKSSPQLHAAVRTWGWETLALTPDEKLLARAIVNATHNGAMLPSLNDLAMQVGRSPEAARAGLEMLVRYDILRPNPNAERLGYVIADERYLRSDFRLDFQFHTVRLSSGRRFSTF